MKKQDIEKMTLILAKTIAKNMELGSTYKKACSQAFNRLNAEYPTVLAAYLGAIDAR